MEWSSRRSTRTSKVLNGEVDGKLLCAKDDVEMLALEDRAETLGPSMSSSSTHKMKILEEFHACRKLVG